MLLIIEKFVNDRGYRYLKMDGGTSIAARQPMITKFNEVELLVLMQCCIFLIAPLILFMGDACFFSLLSILAVHVNLFFLFQG